MRRLWRYYVIFSVFSVAKQVFLMCLNVNSAPYSPHVRLISDSFFYLIKATTVRLIKCVFLLSSERSTAGQQATDERVREQRDDRTSSRSRPRPGFIPGEIRKPDRAEERIPTSSALPESGTSGESNRSGCCTWAGFSKKVLICSFLPHARILTTSFPWKPHEMCIIYI